MNQIDKLLEYLAMLEELVIALLQAREKMSPNKLQELQQKMEKAKLSPQELDLIRELYGSTEIEKYENNLRKHDKETFFNLAAGMLDPDKYSQLVRDVDAAKLDLGEFTVRQFETILYYYDRGVPLNKLDNALYDEKVMGIIGDSYLEGADISEYVYPGISASQADDISYFKRHGMGDEDLKRVSTKGLTNQERKELFIELDEKLLDMDSEILDEER